FILAVETLGNLIRQNKNIKGININDTEIKILQYADDTSGILQDIKSAKEFLKTIDEFGKHSGLKLNIEKTEGMWLGKNKNNQSKPLGISWSNQPLKILGIYMSYNKEENNRLNFEEKITKCKQILNLWQTRNLTLLGKTQIVKTFIISQFSYPTRVNTIPDKYLDEINQMIFKFIWGSKKAKIKRNIMHNTIENGGLKVPDVKSIVQASRCIWIKKYTTPGENAWKTLFTNALIKSDLNHKIIFHCNFDIEQWPNRQLLSPINREILTEWFRFNNTSEISKTQIIWYNKSILIQRKAVFYPTFLQVGIICTDDLYHENKELRNFAFWKAKGIPNKDFLKWAGLVSAVTKHLKKNQREEEFFRSVNLESEELTFLNRSLTVVTPKFIYENLIQQKCGDITNTPRIARYTNIETNWSTYYKIALTIPIDTKTREFQYKFLHDALINNFWLKKWEILESDLCTFCQNAKEDIIHLFWECEHVKRFWNNFKEKYNTVLTEPLNLFLIVCSNSDPLLCTLILLAKRYIYECRFTSSNPDIQTFKWKVAYLRNTEFEIARRHCTVQKYLKKWEPLIV
ncbi:MAG: reverse transcriptase domain-containing protein, partial [Deferribacterota bacterium]|nr:reverse transcriptase domain-containing protein [Deferribacterota bacterium]